MKLKTTHLTQLLLLAASPARGFDLARPAVSRRSWTTLAYNDGQTAEETPTAARAKECIEHFGECSIDELQDLKSALSQESKSYPNSYNANREVARLEHDIGHQLELLKQHQHDNDAFFVDSEPALVERVRECVETYGECSLQEMENLQSSFHKLAESNHLFEDDPSEQEWLEEGLSLQVKLLKHDEQRRDAKTLLGINKKQSSLYPESLVVDRARYCNEEIGECTLDELELLQCSLEGEPFDDEFEKTWLRDGLALQLKLRSQANEKLTPRKHHKRSNKNDHQRPSTTTTSSSLYPEVPIVNEARACAENFGDCSLEQLKSVQHRLEELIKVFDSFEGMDLFADESEKAWILDGLALQINLLEDESTQVKPRPEPPQDSSRVSSADAIYFLYPEVSVIDRARDCAEEFGKCSIEEMQDLIPTLQRHEATAASRTNSVDANKEVSGASLCLLMEEDDLKWLQEGLELQIALRDKSRLVE